MCNAILKPINVSFIYMNISILGFKQLKLKPAFTNDGKCI